MSIRLRTLPLRLQLGYKAAAAAPTFFLYPPAVFHPAARTMTSTQQPEYHLTYWRGLPGRGEFIRLALEAGGASYIDTPGGNDEVIAMTKPDFEPGPNPPPLAPPVLRCGDLLLAQTANILLFLGPRLGLTPSEEKGRLHVNQLTLTALDLADEAHNTHHPVGVGLYYEDQKTEAKRYAEQFRTQRMPKFLGYFERVLGEKYWLVGQELSYADLTLWQCVDGLKFAFPKASKRVLEPLKKLEDHYERVRNIPRVKAYLESDRRQPYGMGIFRHYPELDDE